jgi:hypothetical protein
MSRHKANYTVTDEGRDKGKLFLITEMGAEQAEAWAMRALLALMANNVELPEGFEELGMGGLAELGIKALSGLKWEAAKPLFDEMFQCLQYIPDPKKTHVVRALIPDDIEEVSTRLKLRMEILKLHTDFFTSAVPSLVATKRETASNRQQVTKMSRR